MEAEYLQTCILFVVAFLWTKVIEAFVKRDKLSIESSRKAIHVGIGVLYLLCWAVYDVQCQNCRYLAALVPFSVVIKFLAISTGILKDPLTVKMLCRDGINHPEQLLLGPLMYGIVIILATVYYWLNSPEGLISILILCVGDGMAALGGNFLPLVRLPWNRNKSLGGLLSFVIFSFVSMVFFITWFTSLGYTTLSATFAFSSIWYFKLFCISCASAVLESTELGAFDNIIVPLFALVLTKIIKI